MRAGDRVWIHGNGIAGTGVVKQSDKGVFSVQLASGAIIEVINVEKNVKRYDKRAGEKNA